MDSSLLKPAIISITACAGAYALYYFTNRNNDSIDQIEREYKNELAKHDQTVKLFEAGEAEFLKGNIDNGAELIASALSEYEFIIFKHCFFLNIFDIKLRN